MAGQITTEATIVPKAAKTDLAEFIAVIPDGEDGCQVPTAGYLTEDVIGFTMQKAYAGHDTPIHQSGGVAKCRVKGNVALMGRLALSGIDGRLEEIPAGVQGKVCALALRAAADDEIIPIWPVKMDGAQSGNLADGSTSGGVPVVYTKNIASAASADYDIVVRDKVELLDFFVQKRAGAGGAADTVAAKNGATAITNALDMNVADKTLVRAGTVDDAQSTILAGGTLRFAVVNGGAANAAMMVTAVCVKRA